jgi:hypothetical protein
VNNLGIIGIVITGLFLLALIRQVASFL